MMCRDWLDVTNKGNINIEIMCILVKATGWLVCLGGSIRCWAAVRSGGSEETTRTDSATEGDETTDASTGTTWRHLTPASAAARDRYFDVLDIGNEAFL